MSGIDTGNYTQPLEAVVKAEGEYRMPLPLKVEDRRALFEKWCELNPKALDYVEQKALDYDVRGVHIGVKHIAECLRFDSLIRLVAVPFYDGNGNRHEYCINNSDTSLLARWLLGKYPDLDIETRKSMFDEKKEAANGARGD